MLSYLRRANGDDQPAAMIRTMGFHESYQLAMHTLDQYRGTIVACRYSVPAPHSGDERNLGVLKNRVYDALARVVLAQPHLQVGVVGENSRYPAFVRLPHLDLSKHVSWIPYHNPTHLEPQYLELMQSELDARYSNLATEPGWRVMILHAPGLAFLDVLYVWNHPHHDGMSGKIFHQQLLASLNRAAAASNKPSTANTMPAQQRAGSDSYILELPDPADRLPPPPEVLTPFSMSPKFLVKSVWKEIKPLSLLGTGPAYATWAPVRTSPYVTQFRTVEVDGTTLAMVASACHEQGTTVTGLLHALCLVSLARTLPDTQAAFACRTPYDLRHFLPSRTPEYPHVVPRESLCNYVSVLEHEFSVETTAAIRTAMPPGSREPGPGPADSQGQGQDKSLDLSPKLVDLVCAEAARVRREIKARLDSGTKNDLIGIMKFAGDWRTQQESEAHKPRYLSWLVTNLGVLDGEERGGGGDEGEEAEAKKGGQDAWAIRRAELVLSAEVPSAAFSVSAMTVKDEKMCVTCSWQDSAVDVGVGERLSADLERWLRQIAAFSTGQH
ncbi:alcohol acetyltransferase-domain-containing protein [Astrocystis sublimbata]|nr:alcohol acetyltransferase-domain-containing protein [Astrocystis sublimbata]